jgi:hypothetical protein
MLISGCSHTLIYTESIDGNTIVPTYRRCAMCRSSSYYTLDGKKTDINLCALGYELDNRIFTKKTLNELSRVIATAFPEMKIIKIYPFDIKDRDNNCGLFYLVLINNTTNDLYYEMPFIYIDDTNIQIEYHSDKFQNIANSLFEKGFSSPDLVLREKRFSKGIVKKPFTHVNYYW